MRQIGLGCGPGLLDFATLEMHVPQYPIDPLNQSQRALVVRSCLCK